METLLMEMGVYLTTLEPRLGRETVKNNNWDGVAGNVDKKLDVCFEIFMPSSKVTRAKDRRDIQVHTGPIMLADYKWSCKNWEGELLASQHIMVSSQGGAARAHPDIMGRYTLAKHIVLYDYCPVYKHDDRDYYHDDRAYYLYTEAQLLAGVWALLLGTPIFWG